MSSEESNPAADAALHTPVLLEEVLHYLEPERGGCIVDCTTGLGGHAEAVLQRSPDATLIAVDRDPRALERAARRLSPFADRVRYVPGCFAELSSLLAELGIQKVSGVLADLGVSSMQLDRAERGFSFRFDGPLDMRMGPGELTAEEVVRTYPEEALARIFKEFGEERHARRVARAIVRERKRAPVTTTGELCRVIEEARIGRPGQRIHPATRVFQALRIEVNHELEELRGLLDQAAQLLQADGRLVIISYHSLEDRMVKNALRDLATGEVEPITGRPRAETQVIETLTRKPVRPGDAEVAENPRARSARLRAARRL